MMYNVARETARVEQIYRWSLRIIPPVSLAMYFLLFLSLRMQGMNLASPASSFDRGEREKQLYLRRLSLNK